MRSITREQMYSALNTFFDVNYDFTLSEDKLDILIYSWHAWCVDVAAAVTFNDLAGKKRKYFAWDDTIYQYCADKFGV